jgi:hypothetical protein
MKTTRQTALQIAAIIFVILALGGIFSWKTAQNYARHGHVDTNFFFFWLSGRMVLNGENPYDATQWLAGQDAYGATWRPNQIFPYPLPLAIFTVPLGFFTIDQAFILWEFISQIILALTVFALLQHWRERAPRLLFLPLIIFLLFFGPVYLTLELGSIGPLALGAILATILLLEKQKSLLAGILLSLTILKPPQGLTILALAGVWFLARRDWKAILGAGIGGIVLLLMGLFLDPLWLFKFRDAGQAVLDRTMGIHSNIYSFAYLACRQNTSCMWGLGTIGTILILGLGSIYLWRNSSKLSNWQAFNLIIPLGFMSTIYLWSYDQLPYVIPITWIAGTLIEKTKSFVYAFLFLIIVDLISFAALTTLAITGKDLLSLSTTLLVIGMCLWLTRWKGRAPKKVTGN